MIMVKRIRSGDPAEFEVVVHESNGETRHHVTMDRTTCQQLTAEGHSPERCIEASFRFLLDRESKDSILKQFDLKVISCYFPEFERELPGYLSDS